MAEPGVGATPETAICVEGEEAGAADPLASLRQGCAKYALELPRGFDSVEVVLRAAKWSTQLARTVRRWAGQGRVGGGAQSRPRRTMPR